MVAAPVAGSAWAGLCPLGAGKALGVGAQLVFPGRWPQHPCPASKILQDDKEIQQKWSMFRSGSSPPSPPTPIKTWTRPGPGPSLALGWGVCSLKVQLFVMVFPSLLWPWRGEEGDWGRARGGPGASYLSDFFPPLFKISAHQPLCPLVRTLPCS